jgi:Na+/H+ antiporter NhaC
MIEPPRSRNKNKPCALLLSLILFLPLLGQAAQPDAGFSLPKVGLTGLGVDIQWNGQAMERVSSWSLSNGHASFTGRLHAGAVHFDDVVFEQGGTAMLVLTGDGEVLAQAELRVVPAWLSLLPPLLAIFTALITRAVLPALVLGLWVGAWAVGGLTLPGVFTSLLDTFDIYVTDSLSNRDHVSIILFTFMVAGMVGIISRNGGMKGIVQRIISKAHTARRGQFAVWCLGLVIFFDDYANTLVVGNTSRSVTDRLRISREKLAYIVDSTAAPVATLAVVTTWIGYQVGLIGDAMATIETLDLQPYAVFLNSIPYSFYPILAILLVLLIVLSGLDFGPMLGAERRARSTGKVLAPERGGEAPTEDASLEVKPGAPDRAFNALIPILVMAAGIVVGLYSTGEGETVQEIIGSANAYTALMWASVVAVVAAALLSRIQGILNMDEIVDAWVSGARFTFVAMIILILSWALSDVSRDLRTADFLVEVLGTRIPYQMVPAAVFVLSALTAFATGASWGAMGILVPLVVPLSWAILAVNGKADPDHYFVLYSTVSCVLSGAVWGDHCSPISDTTVLSSLASGCNHIEHVRTQMPYALLAGAVALGIGTVPSGFGVPWWLCLMVACVVLGVLLRILGKPVESLAS